jgi:hypothetical protein
MPPSLISAEQAASLNDQAKNGDFAKYYTEAGVYPLTVKAVASRIAPENDRDAGRPQIILTYGDPDDRYKEFIDRITVTGSEDYVQWNLKRLAKLLEVQGLALKGAENLQQLENQFKPIIGKKFAAAIKLTQKLYTNKEGRMMIIHNSSVPYLGSMEDMQNMIANFDKAKNYIMLKPEDQAKWNAEQNRINGTPIPQTNVVAAAAAADLAPLEDVAGGELASLDEPVAATGQVDLSPSAGADELAPLEDLDMPA